MKCVIKECEHRQDCVSFRIVGKRFNSSISVNTLPVPQVNRLCFHNCIRYAIIVQILFLENAVPHVYVCFHSNVSHILH